MLSFDVINELERARDRLDSLTESNKALRDRNAQQSLVLDRMRKELDSANLLRYQLERRSRDTDANIRLKLTAQRLRECLKRNEAEFDARIKIERMARLDAEARLRQKLLRIHDRPRYMHVWTSNTLTIGPGVTAIPRLTLPTVNVA